MNKQNITLFAAIVLISCISLSSAVVNNVEFNGVFNNGTTLYSDTFNFSNVIIYGKDVYPINNVCTNEVYNITIKEYYYDYILVNKTKKVCNYEVTNITRTKRICRIINSEVNCELVEYTYPSKKRVCVDEVLYQYSKRVRLFNLITEQKNRTVCSINNATIACRNPNGEYTNQLRLENFKYTNDNGLNWYNIPYYNNKIVLNSTVQFRVDIPIECSPNYDINKAIYIIN